MNVSALTSDVIPFIIAAERAGERPHLCLASWVIHRTQLDKADYSKVNEKPYCPGSTASRSPRLLQMVTGESCWAFIGYGISG